MNTPSLHVLIADDQPENLLLLEAFLADKYAVHTVADGQQVLDHLAAGKPADLILLDAVMPVLDGFEACRHIKAEKSLRDIPVLFLSSLANPADEERGLRLGAEDFIHKPFSPAVVLARVGNHLALAQARRDQRDRNAALERLVAERTEEIHRQAVELVRRKREVISAQAATITAFCALAEARDNETGNHIRRTQHYVRVLAQRLRNDPRFAAALDDDSIELLYRSAPLHDVGKVAIPDRILLKPAKLDRDEWQIMMTHCQLGYNAIRTAGLEISDEDDDFLLYAREIALCHHERHDGTGYPQRLAGDAIPLSARLMAVADVYDALISRRPYKPPVPHHRAIEMMAVERGRHFAPAVVDAMVAEADVFRDIARQFADGAEEPSGSNASMENAI